MRAISLLRDVKLYIRNMVCSRCRMMVDDIIRKSGLKPLNVELGEVTLEDAPSASQRSAIAAALHKVGFELIDDRRRRIIEKIKTAIIQLVHHPSGQRRMKLSAYLSEKLHYDYTYLSNLFSEVEGTTIEKFFILQRVEKVKELIVYDEKSLAEIADELGYSSAAYLSTQFRQVTGLTPTYFRNLGSHKRHSLDDL